MRLFAARHRADKQAVGFFWCDTLDDLWWMVDAISDPGLCEYRPISGRAAVTWEGQAPGLADGSCTFDEELQTSDVLDRLRDGLTFGWEMEDFVLGEITKGWKPMPCFDEPGGGYDIIRRENELEAP